MILQRTRHDFRGRGRTAVDQHHDWQSTRQIARRRIIAVAIGSGAATGRYDLAALKEGIGYEHSLVQQTARVVTQVQHDAV